MAANAADEPFIQTLQAEMGERFVVKGEDFSDYGTDDATDVIYVRTGGTEGLFRKVFRPDWKRVRLLASGESNSLAASMEILSYLNRNGRSGEILHGSAQEITARLKDNLPCPSAAFCKPMGHSKLLSGKRYGVIGKPSDWLISSDVDYAQAAEILGAELLDINIEELISLWKDSALADSPCRYAALKPLNVPKYGKPISEVEFAKALRVYEALQKLVDKYHLDGFTLRCFDLLTAIETTGCMGLALLNSQGIVATCEGDVPAMLSMAVAQKVAGTPGFQVNLSKIVGDDLLFAHCTVPLNIVRDYCYDTHFESGIGVAVHGEFAEGPMTLFKLGAKLDQFVAEDVVLTSNQYGDNLCRTQVHIQAPGLSAYLLGAPLGNHHILIPGAFAAELNNVLR